MSYVHVNFWSNALQMQSAMNVLIPDGKGPFPVMYLLHGLSDDYTIWMRRSAIERHHEKRKLIIAMPSGGRSFYTNDPRPEGAQYEDHITQEVVGYIDRTFRTIPRRQSRAIAGLSMGGYGAMMLSMKHPDMFSVACGHSSATFFAHDTHPFNNKLDNLSAHLPAGKYDLFKLARAMARSRKKLALRFDCGTEDFLIAHNREFQKHIKKIGLPHEYHEFAGAHTWQYWDEHVVQTLDFVCERLSAD